MLKGCGIEKKNGTEQGRDTRNGHTPKKKSGEGNWPVPARQQEETNRRAGSSEPLSHVMMLVFAHSSRFQLLKISISVVPSEKAAAR